jgi:DnaJ-class molecular chaperone
MTKSNETTNIDPQSDEAVPGTAGTGENTCRVCGGTGRSNGETCPACGGTGVMVEGIGGA